jgi:acyl-CoA synthetase (AMP-forming)/AMP-acid ligase II
MYTSGTTGRPKGAVLSHQNLLCQSLTLIRVWRLFGDDEVNLCASPLFHIASIGAIAPMTLIGGTTVLLPSGGFSSTGTLDVMEAERITSVFLVPAQWQLLCEDPSLASRDLSALKTMSWGAGPGHHDPAQPDGRSVPWRHQRGRVRPDRDVAGDLRAGRRGRAAQDRFGGPAGEHGGGADRR